MSRMLMVAVGLLCGWSAVQAAEPGRWKIIVELDDSSRFVGEPITESLRWESDGREQEFSLRLQTSLWREENGWVAETEQPDQTKFSGKLLTQELKVNTLVGPVAVPLRHVVKLDVYRIFDQIKLPHPEDLVLYLNFDQNMGKQVRNQASFRHHGAVNGAKWIPNGRRGGAYDFDEQSTIEIPHHMDLCPEQFTLSAWIKPRDPVGPWRLVISKTNTGSWYGGYGFYRYYGEDENLYWYVGNYYSQVVKDPLARDEWVHIAGVFDGKQVIMYLNSEPSVPFLVNQANQQNQFPPNPQGDSLHTTTPFIIGGGSGYNWIGQVDEVMLFRRALSPAEIEKIMELGLPAKTK